MLIQLQVLCSQCMTSASRDTSGKNSAKGEPRTTECSLGMVPAAGLVVARFDTPCCQQTSPGGPPSSRLSKPHLPILPTCQPAPGLPGLLLLPHRLECKHHGAPELYRQHQLSLSYEHRPIVNRRHARLRSISMLSTASCTL